jgi:hypothetical protein
LDRNASADCATQGVAAQVDFDSKVCRRFIIV